MAEDIKNDFYSSEDVETDNNLPALKMAVISPQPTSPNGIGDYTARLIKEFRLLNPQCSIITPSELIPAKKSERTRNWQGKELPSHWPDIFLGAIDAAQVSLVHIQHATYIGHGHDLTRFLVGLKTRGIPCVMTLHGVWSPTLTRRWPVIPTFAEAVEAWGESLNDLILSPYDTAAWSRSLIRILSDEPFRKRAMEAAANLGRKTSGSLVAREHWRVYQKLLPQIPSKEKVK